MFLTSSRILSCGVWLILMRKTSAPASNNFRMTLLSEEAGPSVARILIRRIRLMAWSQVPAADPAYPGAIRQADWRCPEYFRDRPDQSCPEFPARAAPAVVRWNR